MRTSKNKCFSSLRIPEESIKQPQMHLSFPRRRESPNPFFWIASGFALAMTNYWVRGRLIRMSSIVETLHATSLCKKADETSAHPVSTSFFACLMLSSGYRNDVLYRFFLETPK